MAALRVWQSAAMCSRTYTALAHRKHGGESMHSHILFDLRGFSNWQRTRVCVTGLHMGRWRPEELLTGCSGARGADHVSPQSSDTCQYSACCSLPSPGTGDACGCM
jgi:hypothetical protein